MVEERKNELLSSPLYSFVERGWKKWSQEIIGVQVLEEDFLLYLLWSLDDIKEQKEGINDSLWDDVYGGLRKRFIIQEFKADKSDLNYLTNLVCAYALSCLGLAIKDSQNHQQIYSELVNGFGEHWKDIQQLKYSSNMDSQIDGLQNWMIEYFGNDDFYTLSDVIDWSDEMSRSLPARRIEDGIIQIENAQINIHTFNNETGATFNDNSKTING